jgi:hypothetical protein
MYCRIGGGPPKALNRRSETVFPAFLHAERSSPFEGGPVSESCRCAVVPLRMHAYDSVLVLHEGTGTYLAWAHCRNQLRGANDGSTPRVSTLLPVACSSVRCALSSQCGCRACDTDLATIAFLVVSSSLPIPPVCSTYLPLSPDIRSFSVLR